MEAQYEAQYQEGAILGEGTYGQVRQAKRQSDGQGVAVKVLKDHGDQTGALSEVALLDRLCHVNLVRLLDVFPSPTTTRLVFEFGGEGLAKYRQAHKGIPHEVVSQVMHGVIAGLSYMHKNNVIHNDLKPSNILLQEHPLHVRIADLGNSVVTLPGHKKARSTHSVCRRGVLECTLWYRAPEILLGMWDYSTAVDIWSAGCIFCELGNNRPMFAKSTAVEMILCIFQTLGTPQDGAGELPFLPLWSTQFPRFPQRALHLWRGLGTAGRALLSEMLMLTPSTRIAAEAAARHKFFHATATVASQVLRWELERSVRRGTREGGRLALKPVKKSRSKSPHDPSFMILCLVPWLRLSAVEPQHFGKPDLGHLVLQPGMWTKQVLRKPDMWRFAPIAVAGIPPLPFPLRHELLRLSQALRLALPYHGSWPPSS